MSRIENTFAGRWIRTLVSSIRKIAVLCFVVAAAASIWALTRPQVWSAYAIAAVPGSQGTSMGLGNLGGLAGSILGDNMPGISSMMGASGSTLDMNLVYQVLVSRVVFERVIFENDLLSEKSYPTMDDAINEFGKDASVVITDDGFLAISMEADSREKAAAIVNDIIHFANQELSSIVTSRARRSRLAAEELLAAAEDSLRLAQENMERFRNDTGLLFPEEQGVISMNLISSLETDMILAEAELAGLGGSMSASSPAYREVAERVAYLRTAMNSKVRGDSLGYAPGMGDMPSMLRQYENLSIDLETRRALYLMLRQELESLKLEEAKDSPTIEVLVPAVPSALRSSPKRGKIVIKYTFIALLLAVLWTAAATYARGILNDPGTGPFWRNVIDTVKEQLFLKRSRRKKGTST